ncbi:hypothetical protein SAMN02745945_00226 [Peptoclostridium litorale DSM 5388]|uniref:Uncharacterized protein n=1 Tax=Peptoclostridium litorale DSM 5388 TaxID=1121324 RepID=A0A069RQR9_PEPLI|nr:hypothetical protein [Peptoclostridium litorale]KDR96527.1 hypothetical protein CLIT_2c01330 [Peptoclostridium litorale DSM 5388]SIN69538.1 hypothetical protein SAMN02745945_00226 [Peptoclostridium litorale DSM 5388]
MNLEHVKGTPFDYSDDKITVYFEVADKQSAQDVVKNISFIDGATDLDYGFEVV